MTRATPGDEARADHKARAELEQARRDSTTELEQLKTESAAREAAVREEEGSSAMSEPEANVARAMGRQ